METLFQDIRYGLRMLVKKPAFTIVAVLTLQSAAMVTKEIFSCSGHAPEPYWGRGISEKAVWHIVKKAATSGLPAAPGWGRPSLIS
jgi:hypothetical protein